MKDYGLYKYEIWITNGGNILKRYFCDKINRHESYTLLFDPVSLNPDGTENQEYSRIEIPNNLIVVMEQKI